MLQDDQPRPDRHAGSDVLRLTGRVLYDSAPRPSRSRTWAAFGAAPRPQNVLTHQRFALPSWPCPIACLGPAGMKRFCHEITRVVSVDNLSDFECHAVRGFSHQTSFRVSRSVVVLLDRRYGLVLTRQVRGVFALRCCRRVVLLPDGDPRRWRCWATLLTAQNW